MFRDHLSVKKFFYFFALILLKNAASNFGQCSTFGFCLIFSHDQSQVGYVWWEGHINDSMCLSSLNTDDVKFEQLLEEVSSRFHY